MLTRLGVDLHGAIGRERAVGSRARHEHGAIASSDISTLVAAEIVCVIVAWVNIFRAFGRSGYGKANKGQKRDRGQEEPAQINSDHSAKSIRASINKLWYIRGDQTK